MDEFNIIDVSDDNVEKNNKVNIKKKDKFMIVILILIIVLVLLTVVIYFFGYDLFKPMIKV